MGINAEKLDRFLMNIKSLCDMTSPELPLVSETMKHSLDILVSQRPHIRRLRKVVYRRMYHRRNRARRRRR